jgi:hypothetical protein
MGRLTALALLLLAAGCSGGQQEVFTIDSGFQSSFPTHTLEVTDIGLSGAWLHNQADHRVRITSVRFVNPPKQLHMLNVLAYSYKDTHGGVISEAGVLYKECPRQFKPHVLESVTFPPQSDPPWLAVLAFTLNKPGIYHLNRVRIDYQINGHSGWQYQNTNATITVKDPALPGATPLPASAVCGSP